MAKLVDISGKAWTETAKAPLPDSWPLLKKARELSIEKNSQFREQQPGTLEAMQEINLEVEREMNEDSEELLKKDTSSLLADLQQKFMQVSLLEEKASQALNDVV